VEYRNDESAIAYADFQALLIAQTVVDNLKKANRLVDGADDYCLVTSTENMVHAFRVLVSRKEIDCNQIKFRFENKDIPINKYGKINQWDRGFCDHVENMIEEILVKEFDKNLNKGI
jgi:hypothetical protein